MCKVSVLVPVYNVEKYLKQCMDSLLQQTLSDIEIICIDDGSTDRSGELLDAYAAQDHRVRVVHQENGGYGKAMNKGLQLACGEYIGIVESDDFAAPEMFLKLYQTAVKYQAEIVKCNYYCYWATHKIHNRKEPLLKHLPYRKKIHPWDYQRLFCIQPTIWSGIYQRAFLQKEKIIFLETPGAAYQDTSFTFKVLAASKTVVLLPEALLYYRQDNEASSVHSREKSEFVRKEYQEINRFLKKDTKYQALYDIRNQAMLHTYLWNYVRLKSELCEKFLQQMQNDFQQLEKEQTLQLQRLPKTDCAILTEILRQPQRFWRKENILLKLREKIPCRVYRALLIGRTAGIRAMILAVYTKLRRK